MNDVIYFQGHVKLSVDKGGIFNTSMNFSPQNFKKMDKRILKHLTVTGFIQGNDLTEFELLENNLYEAKLNLKAARRTVKEAKEKLNLAIEDSIKKIEAQKKKLPKEMDAGKKRNNSVFSFQH